MITTPKATAPMLMDRNEIAAALGCGPQQKYLWTSGGRTVAAVVQEKKQPFVPDRLVIGAGPQTATSARAAQGQTIAVYVWRGEYRPGSRYKLYEALGDFVVGDLDTSEAGRRAALQDAPGRRDDTNGAPVGVLPLTPV